MKRKREKNQNDNDGKSTVSACILNLDSATSLCCNWTEISSFNGTFSNVVNKHFRWIIISNAYVNICHPSLKCCYFFNFIFSPFFLLLIPIFIRQRFYSLLSEQIPFLFSFTFSIWHWALMRRWNCCFWICDDYFLTKFYSRIPKPTSIENKWKIKRKSCVNLIKIVLNCVKVENSRNDERGDRNKMKN